MKAGILIKRTVFLLFLSLGVAFSAFAQFPEPMGFVNDFAGVLDASSREEMEQFISALQRETGVEIAVATVKSLQPYGSIEEYAVDMAETWGIGEEGKDNGILILLAMEERKFRIEVGYGLQGIIPDGLAGSIMDRSMLPEFQEGEYGNGMLKGVQAVAGIIAKDAGVDLGSLDLSESRRYEGNGESSSPDFGEILGILFILFIFGGRIFLWPLLFMRVGRRGFFGGGFGSGGSSGFHSSGFSGGGGFGGFSGGGFGGGGASRGF